MSDAACSARRTCGLAIALAALGLVAFAAWNGDRPRASRPDAGLGEGELIVFAAASLREAFSVIAEDFERAHPGVDVVFNFAGTQELRTQLEHGAACDVLASADLRHVDELVKRGRVRTPVIFARNEPVMVVAPEASSSIRSLADLPNAERIVIGAAEVPIGRYTLALLDRAAATLGADFRSRVLARVVSREPNVRQVLAKVRLGEAHAGVVYRTDVRGDAAVVVVAIPGDVNVIADYPIAVVSDAAQPGLAQAFIEHVRSNDGQAALRRAGFLAPTSTATP